MLFCRMSSKNSADQTLEIVVFPAMCPDRMVGSSPTIFENLNRSFCADRRTVECVDKLLTVDTAGAAASHQNAIRFNCLDRLQIESMVGPQRGRYSLSTARKFGRIKDDGSKMFLAFDNAIQPLEAVALFKFAALAFIQVCMLLR